jgi:hypothetical protein
METCPLSVIEYKKRGKEVILSLMKRGFKKSEIWMTDIGDTKKEEFGGMGNLGGLFGGFGGQKSKSKTEPEEIDTSKFVNLATFEELKKNRKRLWRYLERDTGASLPVKEGRFTKSLRVYRRKNYHECFFDKLHKHYEVIHKPILKFWGDSI